MNSYKKLANNTLIFSIGTLGSKLVSFFLVPLYTYYLSTTQYGTIDLTITTVNMLIPIISASIFDAVLRFVMDAHSKKEINRILSNSIIIALTLYFIFLLLYPFLNYFNVFGNNLIYLYLILFIQIFEKIFAQYTRAIGKIRIFALNGILLTLTTGLLNILFLVYLELDVIGYYYSLILASFISIIYLIISTGALRTINYSDMDREYIKNLLNYSIPLVPNSLMWWSINASSRYFIRIFTGIAGNGLFAVASRIPSLLNIANQIFSQAWQLSAIEEFNNENKSSFYSKIFKLLYTILFIGMSIILLFLKSLFYLFFSIDYFLAWKVVPFLLLGAIFSSFSNFLASSYIAAKATTGVFKTSVYGGIISLILNVSFIPAFGIVGAGISSAISFFVIFLIRLKDTKKYVNIDVDWLYFSLNIIMLFLQIFIMFIGFPTDIEFFAQISLFLFILVINHELIKLILFTLLKRLIARWKA